MGNHNMPDMFAIVTSRCPRCGARSETHAGVGMTHDGGLIRRCACGGHYDSGIFPGPEIPPSELRDRALDN